MIIAVCTTNLLQPISINKHQNLGLRKVFTKHNIEELQGARGKDSRKIIGRMGYKDQELQGRGYIVVARPLRPLFSCFCNCFALQFVINLIYSIKRQDIGKAKKGQEGEATSGQGEAQAVKNLHSINALCYMCNMLRMLRSKHFAAKGIEVLLFQEERKTEEFIFYSRRFLFFNPRREFV